jgi:hypothetical protein
MGLATRAFALSLAGECYHYMPTRGARAAESDFLLMQTAGTLGRPD